MLTAVTSLRGYKTYIVAGTLALCVAVERGLGVDVPGVTVGDDWMVLLLNAAGLSTLRAGMKKNIWD